MAEHHFFISDTDQFDRTFSESDVTGASNAEPGSTFTYFGTEEPQRLIVVDDDADPDFDETNDVGQELKNSQTVSGVNYDAGQQIRGTWVLVVEDADGNQYDLIGATFGPGGIGTQTTHGLMWGDNIPEPGTELTVLENNNVGQGYPYDQITAATCFTGGTQITTDRGPVPIEELRAGDLVLTQDRGLQPIRWIGSTQLSQASLKFAAQLLPIRIKAGALGKNTPETDLTVSPQHRVLVRSKIAQRMFSADEVLVAAKHLLERHDIEVADDMAEVEYFHILFDQHEVIFSNGAETESLHTGPQALKSLSEAAREEIFTLFPELQDQPGETARLPARPLISGRMGKQLTMRHNKNNRELVG